MSSYTYVVYINGNIVNHFRLPFRLTEKRIEEVCRIQIIPMDRQWAQVLLNDELIYSFPIVNENQIKFYDVKIELKD
jgi:hypothetical protein